MLVLSIEAPQLKHHQLIFPICAQDQEPCKVEMAMANA